MKFGGIESIRKRASFHDENPANLIPLKWNIPKRNHPIVGEKIKKLYTNSTFLQDLKSYFDVSLFCDILIIKYCFPCFSFPTI